LTGEHEYPVYGGGLLTDCSRIQDEAILKCWWNIAIRVSYELHKKIAFLSPLSSNGGKTVGLLWAFAIKI